MVDFLKFRASDSESAARLAPPAPRASACRRRTRAAHAATGFKFPERIPADREGAGSEPRPFTLSGSQEPRTPPPSPREEKGKEPFPPQEENEPRPHIKAFSHPRGSPVSIPPFQGRGRQGTGQARTANAPTPARLRAPPSVWNSRAPPSAWNCGKKKPRQAPGTVNVRTQEAIEVLAAPPSARNCGKKKPRQAPGTVVRKSPAKRLELW